MEEFTMRKNITLFILKVLSKTDIKDFILIISFNSISCIIPLVCTKLVSNIVSLFTGDVLLNKNALLLTTFGYLLLNILLQIIQPIQEFVHQRFQDKVGATSEEMLYRKINSFKGIDCFENHEFYNKLLLAKNGSGIRFISITDMFTSVFCGIITVIITSVYLVQVHWGIAAIALLSIFPATVYNFWAAKNRLSLFRSQSEPARKLQYFGELFTQANYTKEMHLFNLGAYIINKYKELFACEFARINTERKKHALVGVACTTFSAFLSGTALFMYIQAALTKRVEAGSIVLYISLLPQFVNGLRAIINGITQTKVNNNYVQHFVDFLNLEVPQKGDKLLCDSIKSIVFENVSFKYPGSDKFALKNVSFSCVAPQLVAIVGENGSGKSTLIKLLLDLFSPDSGKILVNNENLQNLNIDCYRNAVSGVFQSPAKFAFSVNENLKLADVEADISQDMIISACETASADEFISQLPDKYETILGKQFRGGTEISDGQWQKLSLARAICSNADMMIFDEASADLDPKAEHMFYRCIKEYAKDKLTFYITHRLSGTKDADLILVMNNGQLVESGTHKELIEADGIYKKLYFMQADGYKASK